MLLWKIKHGNKEALCRIYTKYKNDTLALANSLLNDLNAAEDVVHDVFVSFVQSADSFKLTGSLKGYLLTCVANLARDRLRAKKKAPLGLDKANTVKSNSATPSQIIISQEELLHLRNAIEKLPYQQREVVVLHLQGGRTFRQIAEFQNTGISTIQSRYRYGLEKLRSLLNSEAQK